MQKKKQEGSHNLTTILLNLCLSCLKILGSLSIILIGSIGGNLVEDEHENQWGQCNVLLSQFKFYYNTSFQNRFLHNLCICTASGIWAKVLWSTHTWMNSTWLCLKLLFARSYFTVISHSACCKWLTSLFLCPHVILSVSLTLSRCNICRKLEAASHQLCLSLTG